MALLGVVNQLQQLHDRGLRIVGDGLALVGFHGNQRVSGRIAVVEFAARVARRGGGVLGALLGAVVAAGASDLAVRRDWT